MGGSHANSSLINFAEKEFEEDEDDFSVVVETRQSFAKQYTTEFYNRSVSHMGIVNNRLSLDNNEKVVKHQ